MPHPQKVPITPSVLQWALDSSGYSQDELAHRIGVDRAELVKWLDGGDRPTVTQFRSLATALKRSSATFFLPSAPSDRLLPVEFRPAPGDPKRRLLAAEMLAIRESEHIQRAIAWLATELGQELADLPRVRHGSDPERAAQVVRQRLGIAIEQQLAWKSSSEALRAWRTALERQGILVFLLPMGSESARGFSVWDDHAPLIAANTHWNTAARVFTLIHELGHLITRTSSICAEAGRRQRLASTTDIERWCEQFAAAVLMPRAAIEQSLEELKVAPGARITGLPVPGRLAKQYHVSLRAAVLRLIELERAPKQLYASVPKARDSKPRGGGGEGRSRTDIRVDEYGHRVTETVIAAVQRDLIDASTAMKYLDVTYSGLDQLLALTKE